VTDEAWANAAKLYDEDQLAGLVSLIAVINSWNRLNAWAAASAARARSRTCSSRTGAA
jgi:alkylhydroperoxidase family enzyme